MIVTALVAAFVTPPDVKDAVIVVGVSAVTDGAVRTPPALMVPIGDTLQVGVTVVVEPSFHVAVAVYVPVDPSSTLDGPVAMAMLCSTRPGTSQENGGESSLTSAGFAALALAPK
jgi:hypothetical protein